MGRYALASCFVCAAVGACGTFGTSKDDVAPDAIAPDDAAIDAITTTDGPSAADASSVDAAGGCPGGEDCERVIFITKGQMTGKMNGINGADEFCNAQAKASGSLVAGRTFIAWLGTTTVSAQRHVASKGRYVLADGTTVVASNFGQLLSGSLTHAIDRDQNNLEQNSRRPWTGLLSDGGSSNANCSDWTLGRDAGTGTTGSSSAKNGEWTEGSSPDSCDATHQIYCIEK